MNLLFIITNFAPNLLYNGLLTHKIFINNTILLIKNLFKWNIISLKLNGENPYNLYVFIFILICVLSSLIIRSSVISLDMLNSNNEIIIMIIKLLFLFTILYTIKLILDILKRGIQAFKIIPEFIQWYKQDVKDIKQIITSYYILNILLILLSSYILYHILIKLNIFIENVYLYIIISGIISSFVFFNYYPINKFYLNTNVKEYPLFVYLLFIFFIMFYLFILPFIFIKVINSDKMLLFKNDFIKQCLNNIECNMSSQESGRRVINNLNNSSNTISVPDSTELDISNNLTNTNNQILVRNNNQVNLTVNHHNYSLASTAHVQSQPQSQGNSLLNQSNNASTSSQPQLNTISPPEYNASNSSNASNQSLKQLLNDQFGDLFTTFDNLNIENNNNNNSFKGKNIIITNNFNNDNNKLIINSNIELNNTNNIIEVPNNENSIFENISQEYIDSPKIKSNFKNPLNQLFKGLRKIKSESNIFNKTIEPKLYKEIQPKEFILDKDNLLKIPDHLYKDMFNNTKDIISWLKIQDKSINFDLLNKLNIFIELNSNIERNMNLQKLLLSLINDNNKCKFINCLNYNSYINYEVSKLEEVQLEFNKNLCDRLNLFYKSSLSYKNLREFYILNDLDYLFTKHKNKLISIDLINNLIICNGEINTICDYKYFILNNKEEINKLYNLYEINLTKLYNCFNDSIIQNHHNKCLNYDLNNKNIVNWLNLRKTREINFFSVLFNLKNN